MADDDVQAMTLRLPRAMYERLRREAFERRVSITSLVLDALDLALRDPRTEASMTDYAGPQILRPPGREPILWACGHYECGRDTCDRTEAGEPR